MVTFLLGDLRFVVSAPLKQDLKINWHNNYLREIDLS